MGRQEVARIRPRDWHTPALRDGCGERVPRRRRRLQEEEVDVTSHRKSVEELELTLRESRGTEDRQALGQIDDVRVGGDPRAGTRKRFHRVGLADVLAHPPPELRLPAVARGQRGTAGVVIAADAPRLQHVGTVLGVAIEQHC